MCNPASFVILKSGEVLFGKYHDSHEEIIRENKLTDTDSVKFVRVEISPPNNNYRLPLTKWQYQRDQDLVPEWYNDKWGETLCQSALPRWAKTHIYKTGSHKFSNGLFNLIFMGSAQAKISDQTGGNVLGYGNAQITSSGQTWGYVWGYDNAQIIITAEIAGNNGDPLPPNYREYDEQ